MDSRAEIYTKETFGLWLQIARNEVDYKEKFEDCNPNYF